jgi:hypothetical protein
MNTLESVARGRDPVAFAVEKYLRLVEQDGVHQLSIKQRREGVRLRFAGQSAEGMSLDIALIRLAALLLGRESLREPLMEALRGPVAAEDRGQHAGRYRAAHLRSE